MGKGSKQLVVGKCQAPLSSRALGKDADFTANVIFQISISDMHGEHAQPRSITEGPARDFHKPYSFLTGHFLHEHLLWLLIKVALRGPKVGEPGEPGELM